MMTKFYPKQAECLQGSFHYYNEVDCMATKKTTRGASSKAARAGKAQGVRAAAPRKKAQAPTVSVPAAPVVTAAPQAARNPWILWILVAMIVLVGSEVVMMIKGKMERQGALKLIRVIGERGGPPEATGKFWGPGNIRVDRKHDRVCMIDSSFYKVIFWNLQDGTFITELDKKGAHTPVPAGSAVLQGDFVGRAFAEDVVHEPAPVGVTNASETFIVGHSKLQESGTRH